MEKLFLDFFHFPDEFGGGSAGQAGAARLGIARALVGSRDSLTIIGPASLIKEVITVVISILIMLMLVLREQLILLLQQTF